MKDTQCRPIKPEEYLTRILDLLQQLNPGIKRNRLEKIQLSMVQLPHYICFGLFHNGELIGISSGWTTVRIYCGKQLELDNVVIDSKRQSQGFGKYFMNAIKAWTVSSEYESLSLNTYVQNARSHKFYFNEGFKILGFHFENSISV